MMLEYNTIFQWKGLDNVSRKQAKSTKVELEAKD